MALFDIVKRRELEEIERLQEETGKQAQEIEKLKEQIAGVQAENGNLRQENDRLSRIENYKEAERLLRGYVAELSNDIKKLYLEREDKRKEVASIDEAILLQEFGLYKPMYDFSTSEGYKERLEEVRNIQKELILNKKAAMCSTSWTIGNSRRAGEIMENQNIKQIIRCFNDECDVLIGKVKFNNVTAFEDRIRKSFESLNKINTRNCVFLTKEYLNAKIEELRLAHEYAVKKEEEREEQRRIKQQLREEERLRKEIEEKRKDIAKEQSHYQNALDAIDAQISECPGDGQAELLQKREEILNHLNELDSSMDNLDYREANKRAGYVYVISNIGSFGENVYKIGMTRRLEPKERVEELGDASVPFYFDVHALIFSDDAPKLEAALHEAFKDKRVNMVNPRREFFHVSLEEIEAVVKANYDKTVEFNKTAQAEQFRESCKMRENKTI